MKHSGGRDEGDATCGRAFSLHRRRNRAWLVLVVLACLSRFVSPAAEAPPEGRVVPFRLGFSKSTVGDITYNDALAALRVWTLTLLESFALPVSVDITISKDLDALAGSYREGHLDGLSLGAEEFLATQATPKMVYAIQRNGSIRTRYLLLARKDAPLSLPEILSGKAIQFHRTSATCLVPAWIESLRADLDPPCKIAGRSQLEEIQGPSKSILRVFFRQAEACVATESAFAVACEMNPQLGGALKVLATSPELITSAFFLHDSVDPDLRAAIDTQIVEFELSPKGKQVLTVFQGERLLKIPLAEWEPTLEWVRTWRQAGLKAAAARSQPGGS